MTTTLDRLKAEITELLVLVDPIESSATLQELGADSLDIVDLSCLIEDEFEIEIPESEIKPETTVAELAAMIESRR